MSTSQNLEHYGGPGNIPPTVAVALQEQDERTQSCPEKFCFYPVSHDRLCWQVVTCQSLPAHMRSEHGVYAKPQNEHDQYAPCISRSPTLVTGVEADIHEHHSCSDYSASRLTCILCQRNYGTVNKPTNTYGADQLRAPVNLHIA
ncbi:hypothetical protein M404DRAFT_26663 [Pisolithus tinctorius Marx 270]|uniref:Uncharacterized protein n=1 Tax=Pisolithus tinctorius Marx 270 TaxID=870435 RepID=A0A0C3K3G9_PISTI|nr:hypothetical protein M404DRAFT_26663 [Pisolithus tinctorius Marx 270]